MSKSSPEQIAERSRKRITEIRAELAGMDYVCSGTLLKRMKTCGHPSCRCAQDPGARHGPYYEWGHMKGGKLVHRLRSVEQANLPLHGTGTYCRPREIF